MCDPLFISVQLRINKMRYQISVLVTYIHCVVLARNYTHFVTINNSKFLKDRDNGSNTRFVHDLKLCIIFYFYVIISVFMCHIRKLNCSMWYLDQNVYLCNKIYCTYDTFKHRSLRIQKSSYSMA